MLSDSESEHAYSSKGDNEAQGRWTREEHQLFLKAIKMYGREWRLVQQAVKTRTSAQIRSHAQKYFQKIAKQEPARFLTGASEDAFVVLELFENVLKKLKCRRDDTVVVSTVSSPYSSSGNSTPPNERKYSVGSDDMSNDDHQHENNASHFNITSINKNQEFKRIGGADGEGGGGCGGRKSPMHHVDLQQEEMIALEVLCNEGAFKRSFYEMNRQCGSSQCAPAAADSENAMAKFMRPL